MVWWCFVDDSSFSRNVFYRVQTLTLHAKNVDTLVCSRFIPACSIEPKERTKTSVTSIQTDPPKIVPLSLSKNAHILDTFLIIKNILAKGYASFFFFFVNCLLKQFLLTCTKYRSEKIFKIYQKSCGCWKSSSDCGDTFLHWLICFFNYGSNT